jgi:hypothetical protein
MTKRPANGSRKAASLRRGPHVVKRGTERDLPTLKVVVIASYSTLQENSRTI